MSLIIFRVSLYSLKELDFYTAPSYVSNSGEKPFVYKISENLRKIHIMRDPNKCDKLHNKLFRFNIELRYKAQTS